MSPSGKIDRAALRSPLEECAEQVEHSFSGLHESAIGTIWRELLGTESLGPEENFFSAGGDSMKAIQMVARARKQGIPLTIEDIGDAQTIRSLAARAATRIAGA